MTHFDTINKKPACELCVSEIPKSNLNKHTIRSLDEAAQEKEKNIHDEIKNIEKETQNYWNNQLKMKRRISDFTQNQKDICLEERFKNRSSFLIEIFSNKKSFNFDFNSFFLLLRVVFYSSSVRFW